MKAKTSVTIGILGLLIGAALGVAALRYAQGRARSIVTSEVEAPGP